MPRRARTNGEGKVIVALDIDGTLGDYHGHFLKFAEDWIGRPMPAPGRINPGLRLHRFMGVPLRTYRECKLAYRQGGLKRSMPVYDGAAELTQGIRKLGGEVWLCTTRPYLRLDNIDPDTREWLRRNDIEYDALLFDPAEGVGRRSNKYKELKRQAGHRVGAVFDDLPEMCFAARAAGLDPVYIRTQPYNHYLDWPNRVKSCHHIWKVVQEDFGYWEARLHWKDHHDPRLPTGTHRNGSLHHFESERDC